MLAQGRRAGRVAGVALFCISIIVLGAGCRPSTDPVEGEKPTAETPAHQTPAETSPVKSASGAPVDGLRRVPACELIAREEMSGMLGAPIGRPAAEDSDQKTSCVYPPGEAGSYAQAEVTIDWQHGGGPTFERQLADAFGGTAVGRQVARRIDLGDEAAYNAGVLTIRLGAALITVTLPMRPQSEEQALAIGQKIVERLGGATNRATAAPATPDAPPPEVMGALAVVGELARLFEDGDKKDDKAAAAAPPVTPAPTAWPVSPDGLSIGGECPALPAGAEPLEATASSKIPLIEGLTLSSTWVRSITDDFEHECLKQVVAVTSSFIDFTLSCPRENRPPVVDKRRLCRADLRDSSFYLTQMWSELPSVVAGVTSFSLSQRSFRELKIAGRTRHRYIAIADEWRTRAPLLKIDVDGILAATPLVREPYKVIVNDGVVELPTIVAKANQTTEWFTTARILDDEGFPLVLDYHALRQGFRIHVTKISFPTGGELEKRLATEKRVDVYGIYFDFASDRLRAESEPVLKEIAGVLANNAGWTLTINGHTDNIGGEASNMDLSRRRSQSVRRALSERHKVDPARLTTAGFGASQPKEDNSTIEGRAKNRRVELVRR